MKTLSSMTGWSNRRFRLDWVTLMIMTLFPTLNMAETARNTEEPPSVELLEFLSEWETNQGQWAGPAQFEDDSFDQLFEESDSNSVNNEENNEDIEEVEDAE